MSIILNRMIFKKERILTYFIYVQKIMWKIIIVMNFVLGYLCFWLSFHRRYHNEIDEEKVNPTKKKVSANPSPI